MRKNVITLFYVLKGRHLQYYFKSHSFFCQKSDTTFNAELHALSLFNQSTLESEK